MSPRTRAIACFAFGGAIGPLLIPVLAMVGFESSLYRPLYRIIAVLCPAWLLGVLEYSLGSFATGAIIFVVNVLLWSAVGLAFRFPGTGAMRVALACFASLLFTAYAYWVSDSLLAPIGLLLVLGALFIVAKRGEVPNAA